MPNPEPPSTNRIVKVKKTSFAELRAAAQKRALVFDNIDALLREFPGGEEVVSDRRPA